MRKLVCAFVQMKTKSLADKTVHSWAEQTQDRADGTNALLGFCKWRMVSNKSLGSHDCSPDK